LNCPNEDVSCAKTELEERRKAFVDRDADYATKIGLCGTLTAKKKRKQLYESRASTQFDRWEPLPYITYVGKTMVFP
jgi:hypothetical protein